MELSTKINTYLESNDSNLVSGTPYEAILESYKKLLENGEVDDRIVPGSIGEKIDQFIEVLKRDASSPDAATLFSEIQTEVRKLAEKHYETLKSFDTKEISEKLWATIDFLKKEQENEPDVGKKQEIEETIKQITAFQVFIETEASKPDKPVDKFAELINGIEDIYKRAIQQISSLEARKLFISQLLEIESLKREYLDEKGKFVQEAKDKETEAKNSLLYETGNLFWEDSSIWEQFWWNDLPGLQTAFDEIEDLEKQESQEIVKLWKNITLGRQEALFGAELPPWKIPFTETEITKFDKSVKDIELHVRDLVEKKPEFVARLKQRYPDLVGKSQLEVQEFLVERFLTDLALSTERGIRESFNEIQKQVGNGSDKLSIGDNIITYSSPEEKDKAATSSLILLRGLNIEAQDRNLWVLSFWGQSALGDYLDFYLWHGIEWEWAFEKWAITLGFLIVPLLYSQVFKRREFFVYKKSVRDAFWKLRNEDKDINKIKLWLEAKPYEIHLPKDELEELDKRSKALDFYEELANKEKNSWLLSTIKDMRKYDIFIKADRFFYVKLETSYRYPGLRIRNFWASISPLISWPGWLALKDGLKILWGHWSFKSARDTSKWIINPKAWLEGSQGRVEAFMENDFLQRFSSHSLVSKWGSDLVNEFVSKNKGEKLTTTKLREIFGELIKSLDELKNEGLNASLEVNIKKAFENNLSSHLWEGTESPEIKLKKVIAGVHENIWEVKILKWFKIPTVFPEWTKEAFYRKWIEWVLDPNDGGQLLETLKRDEVNLQKLKETSYTDLHWKLLHNNGELNLDFLQRLDEHLIKLKLVKRSWDLNAEVKNFIYTEKLEVDIEPKKGFIHETDESTSTEEKKKRWFRNWAEDIKNTEIDPNSRTYKAGEWVRSVLDSIKQIKSKEWSNPLRRNKTPSWETIIEPETTDDGRVNPTSPIDREGAIDAEWEDVTENKNAWDNPKDLRSLEALKNKKKLAALDLFDRFVLQVEDEGMGGKISSKVIQKVNTEILNGMTPVDDLQALEDAFRQFAKSQLWITIDEIKTREALGEDFIKKNTLPDEELEAFRKALRGEEISIERFTWAKWLKYIRQAARW